MVLFKSVVNALTKYCIQFSIGYSGLQPQDNFLISGFNILMTNWFVLSWSILDQDVSLSKYGTEEKEKLAPYSMSALFAYSRQFVNRRRFFKLIVLTDLYAFVCGFVMYAIYSYAELEGLLTSDGKTFGLYTFGAFSVLVTVMLHHVQVIINTRNWSPILFGMFCFSASMAPLTYYIASYLFPNASLYMGMYSVVLQTPSIWLLILVSLVLTTMPLFLIKMWTQVVKYPQFYSKD